ncbi:heavy metal-associated isoprenylated plant protein 21 isoform X1 [Spinacia oleracea]|uniref:Heavy metal-associated isoprenylated plant protein 21 isoform X1 n=2 Tax=Spinacia oleracea TaxID=3562 RepID=A0A9R0K5K5_SPIOL|nr:heavy metal-associated isoprenylated plant protein 21 isoform X1 [Spinacia oleracea]
MGALDYFANFCTVTSTRNRRKPFQTVEIKVKMDCDGCERRVKSAVTSLRGVRSVEIIRKQSKVTVTGHVDPNKVLKKVKETGKKRAEFWPYIEHNLVAYPYVAGAYDKRAPPGYVKDVPQAYSSSYNLPQDNISTFFSDDNANACSIM